MPRTIVRGSVIQKWFKENLNDALSNSILGVVNWWGWVLGGYCAATKGNYMSVCDLFIFCNIIKFTCCDDVASVVRSIM